MIAIYCRISREKEAGKDRSINDQKLSGIELAKKLNIPYRVYIDEGISGTLPIHERPALSNLISDIYSKEISKIYVYDQSRLERSPEARFILKDLFIKENIELYTESGLVGKDIEDEFTGDLMSVINNFYTKITSKKIKSVLKRNAESNKVHAFIPFGFTKDVENKLIIDNDESEIVKKIYEWSLNGIGVNSIANKLNDLKVKTAYNKLDGTLTVKNKYTGELTVKNKSEIVWSGNSVRSIIVNPIYKGVRIFSGIEYQCEAIFDEFYWKQVNDNLKNNANNSGKKVEHKYMLKGLLRCGKCGRNMYGRTRTNKKDNYYMCSSKRIKTENCGNRSINIDFLENWLFSKFFLDYSLYKKVKEYLGSLDTIDSKTSLEAEIKELTNKFNQVERKINKLILLAEEGTLTDAEIKHRISALRSEKNDLTIKLNNSNNQLKLIAINNSNDLLKGLKVKSSLSFNDKRKILNSYIKNIKVEFIDNYYKIDIEWNILGYRDKVYLVHKSYGHYIYNDIEYSLKESKEKTTLERVLKNLKKYDKPPREK